MQKFFDWLEDKLMPLANFFGSQRHLLAMRDGIVSAIPLTIIGSIFLILACPPVSPDNLTGIGILDNLLLGWYHWQMQILHIYWRHLMRQWVSCHSLSALRQLIHLPRAMIKKPLTIHLVQ